MYLFVSVIVIMSFIFPRYTGEELGETYAKFQQAFWIGYHNQLTADSRANLEKQEKARRKAEVKSAIDKENK